MSQLLLNILSVPNQQIELNSSSEDSTNCGSEQFSGEEEIEQENEFAESNRNKQQNKLRFIDFPSLESFYSPIKQIDCIPRNYCFKNKNSYQQTLFRLEEENFFRTFRESLNHHIEQNFEDKETTFDGFHLIDKFFLSKCSFQSCGLILDIVTTRYVPRYEQEKTEVKNNEIIIFVSLKSKQIFVGKSIVESKAEDKKSQDNQIEEEEEIEMDEFEMIECSQNFKIRMNIQDNLDEILLSQENFSTTFKLVIPDTYWHSLEKSLNCQIQFQDLQKIAFFNQTLSGQSGFSTFPKYNFLQNQREVEYFKSYIDFEMSKYTELDQKQQVALKHALYNQNAIIQGPPGTGKTYLASKIINLIRNVHLKHLNKPILVISQKNLSLDKILEKLVKLNKNIKILRLGTRVSNEEIKKFTVHEQEGPTPIPAFSPSQKVNQINEELLNCISNIGKRTDEQRFLKQKEIKFPEHLQNQIKNKLLNLLQKELDENSTISEECGEKIFTKWFKGKLNFERLQTYLRQSGINLQGEQQEKLSNIINTQHTKTDLNLSPKERHILNFIKNARNLDELTVKLCQFLHENQETIEIDIISNKMRDLESTRQKQLMKNNSNYQRELSEFMENYEVIGMTFTGYHTNYSAIQQLGAEIVVVEEASEVIESQFYPVLTPNLKHLIQIGDHKQLRPLIRSQYLIRNFNYQMSYFERLITVNKIDYVTLYNQRRMRPEFANFTRLFYGNQYTDDKVAHSLIHFEHISKNGMYMLQHSFPDYRECKQSYLNTFEAMFVKELVFDLIKKSKIDPKKITVITTYKSQKILIQKLLTHKDKEDKNNKIEVEVHTVDSFQGDENDVIILSCVRSNMNKKCGFVLNPQRINVAFSRARRGFFCIGNLNTFAQQSQDWKKIIKLGQEQFSFGGIGVESFYKKIAEKAEKQEQRLLKNQKKSENICNMCEKGSHIGNCGPKNLINNAFQMIEDQLAQQSVAPLEQRKKKSKK